jgi:hypothetical protein
VKFGRKAKLSGFLPFADSASLRARSARAASIQVKLTCDGIVEKCAAEPEIRPVMEDNRTCRDL